MRRGGGALESDLVLPVRLKKEPNKTKRIYSGDCLGQTLSELTYGQFFREPISSTSVTDSSPRCGLSRHELSRNKLSRYKSRAGHRSPPVVTRNCVALENVPLTEVNA